MRKLSGVKGLILGLPKSIRDPILRQLVDIKIPPSTVVFKLAETLDELEQSFHILYQSYYESNFTEYDPLELRVTKYHLLPTTSTLIGKVGDEVIATLSIIKDSSFGIPSEKIIDVTPFRVRGLQVAEISSLAIKKGYRGKLIYPFLKYLYQYSLYSMGLNQFFATTTIEASPFYEAILLFDKLNDFPIANYQFANGVTVHAMSLNLDQAYENYAKYYAHKDPRKNLFSFFTTKDPSFFNLPKRNFFQTTDPVMTPEYLDHFLSKKPNILTQFSDSELQAMLRIYAHTKYTQVLKKYLPSPVVLFPIQDLRKSRYHVKCTGEVTVDDYPHEIIVIDSSETGVRVKFIKEKTFKKSPVNLKVGQKYKMNCLIGPYLGVELETELKWSNQHYLCGFEILNFKGPWVEFIKHLNNTNLHQSQQQQIDRHKKVG